MAWAKTIRFGPPIGICLPRCDPFDGNSCPDTGTCLVAETVQHDTFAHGSHQGDLSLDQPCDNTHACAPGLMCANMTNPNLPSLCRPVCDAEHPCSDGTSGLGSYGYGHCD